MLGTPKAVAALLSGEMKDTAQLNSLAVYGLEKFYSKKERAAILRSFPGIASMLPKGIFFRLSVLTLIRRRFDLGQYDLGTNPTLTSRIIIGTGRSRGQRS